MDEPHKPHDREEDERVIRDQGESGQSDYYYDDSTNYETYRDESDEPVDPDEDDTGS